MTFGSLCVLVLRAFLALAFGDVSCNELNANSLAIFLDETDVELRKTRSPIHRNGVGREGLASI
jgi:hypothetical protein